MVVGEGEAACPLLPVPPPASSTVCTTRFANMAVVITTSSSPPDGDRGTERGSEGWLEGKYRSTVDAREPQNPTKSEGI